MRDTESRRALPPFPLHFYTSFCGEAYSPAIGFQCVCVPTSDNLQMSTVSSDLKVPFPTILTSPPPTKDVCEAFSLADANIQTAGNERYLFVVLATNLQDIAVSAEPNPSHPARSTTLHVCDSSTWRSSCSIPATADA